MYIIYGLVRGLEIIIEQMKNKTKIMNLYHVFYSTYINKNQLKKMIRIMIDIKNIRI